MLTLIRLINEKNVCFVITDIIEIKTLLMVYLLKMAVII